MKKITLIVLLMVMTVCLFANEYPKALDWATDRGVFVGTEKGLEWDRELLRNEGAYAFQHYDSNVAMPYVDSMASTLMSSISSQGEDVRALKEQCRVLLQMIQMLNEEAFIKEQPVVAITPAKKNIFLRGEVAKYSKAIDLSEWEAGYSNTLFGLDYELFYGNELSELYQSNSVKAGLRAECRF